MDLGDIIYLLRDGIFQILMLVSPILGTALVVGLLVAIFQATTSIQEQTLTFVPKFFSILGILALLGAWMFASLRGYTFKIFEMIPQVAR